MHVIVVQRTIEAPVDRVWEVITDLEGTGRQLPGATKIERVTGDGYDVGTVWRETRKLFGRENTEEMTVAEVEAPTRTVVVASSDGTDYRTEFLLAPEGDATTLTLTFSAVSQGSGFIRGLVERVLTPVGVAVTKKMIAADLAAIAKAAERN